MSKTIEVIVGPTGEVTVQTRGFAGPACLEASRLIEQALGQQISEQRTAEFYQAQQVEQVRQQHG